MNDVRLNLARKWRSQNFDQLVGQDLSVRMLKNSLYLDHYFPVYLFSGQRGCGKTSAARIFAAAINCENLPLFQKNPQSTLLPCAACASCTAMLQASHPDFVEIDAASHTGVDNVREIVESSSLLPVIGRKKVYLIDEAHMLSKAAFNALLKVLEEPSKHTIFMMATTDPQKILDTVRSRCFQLFFKPVESSVLKKHLTQICNAENIVIHDAALSLIIEETDGSVRDAINAIEQMRFSQSVITKESVMQSLGHVSDTLIVALLKAVFIESPKQIVTFFSDESTRAYDAMHIWRRIVEMTSILIRMKYGIFPTTFAEHYDALNQLAQKHSISQMQQMLTVLSDHELGFLKTTAQHVFLEMMLLRLATRNGVIDSDSGNSNSSLQAAPGALEEEDILDDEDCDSDDEYEDDEDDDLEDEEDASSAYWSYFITAIEQLQEPLLLSIFSQSNVEKWHQANNDLHISVPKELSFFHQTLEEYKPTWTQCLKNSFKCNELQIRLAYNKSMAQDPVVTTVPVKEQHPIESATLIKKAVSNNGSRSFAQATNNNQPRVNQKHTTYRNHYNKTTAGSIVDVSDAALWPKAHLISQFFSGTVVEYRG